MAFARVSKLLRPCLKSNAPAAILCSISNVSAESGIKSSNFESNLIKVDDLVKHFGVKKGVVLELLRKVNEKVTDYQPKRYVSLKEAERVAMEMARINSQPKTSESNLKLRPPIVTVMGHVDHGKTTLLDRLRNTSVASGEAGGITQHIGAFSVPMATGRTITFLDTPGHAAFSAMRSRGVNATDIIVLVIAANDGIMPQTIECIEMAQKAKVPMVVAINKCDKHGHKASHIKQALLDHSIQVEEFGGDIQCVEISALTGQGLDELEESVITQSDLMNLTADSSSLLEGIIIETKTAKGLGPVATVLVLQGTLRKGFILVCGSVWAQARSLHNERGTLISEAPPSIPVLVSGWKDLPQIGQECLQVKDRVEALKVVHLCTGLEKILRDNEEREKLKVKWKEEEWKKDEKRKQGRKQRRGLPPPPMIIRDKREGPLTASVIIKSDVAGSLEALEEILQSSQPEQIKVDIVHSGVGIITEEDIDIAATFRGVILAYNVIATKAMIQMAIEREVTIISHNVIYKLLEQLKDWLEYQIPREIEDEIIGEAIVQKVFKMSGTKKAVVGGCRVKTGQLVKEAIYQLKRGEEIIHEGKLIGMKRGKDDIQTAAKETECGLSFKTDPGWKEGDIIVCYKKKEVAQKLTWELGF